MRSTIKNLQNNECFCALASEGTDSSNPEFLSLVLRQVTEGLQMNKYFTGFYRLDNMSSECAARVIKVIVFSTHLKSIKKYQSNADV